MSLTKSPKVANAMFFDRIFLMLKENGVWTGDAGMMRKKTMPKIGAVWLAERDTYNTLKAVLPNEYLAKIVLCVHL